ncbi:hypothetical protein D1872_253890 [compost metagenome]
MPIARINWEVSSPKLKVKDSMSTFNQGFDIPLNRSGSSIPKGIKIRMFPAKFTQLCRVACSKYVKITWKGTRFALNVNWSIIISGLCQCAFSCCLIKCGSMLWNLNRITLTTIYI